MKKVNLMMLAILLLAFFSGLAFAQADLFPCLENGQKKGDASSFFGFGKPPNTCNQLKNTCQSYNKFKPAEAKLRCEKTDGCIYSTVSMGEGGPCVQTGRCIPDYQKCPALYANRNLCCGGQWTKGIRTNNAGDLEWVCELKNFPASGQTYCVSQSRGCAGTSPRVDCCSNEKSFLVGKRKYCKLPSGKVANPIDQKYCPREGGECELSNIDCSPKDVNCPLDYPNCVQAGGGYKCSRGQCFLK